MGVICSLEMDLSDEVDISLGIVVTSRNSKVDVEALYGRDVLWRIWSIVIEISHSI